VLTRVLSLTPALLLLTACPGPKSDADSEGPDTSSGSSGDTSSGSSGDPSSGSSGDNSSGSGGEFPACVARDPAVLANYSFDLSQWQPDFDPQMGTIDVDAKCTVASLSRAGTTVSLALACVRGMEEVAIPATIELPEDLMLGVEEGEAVHLRYLGHGAEHHTSPGSQFALHSDDAAARLLLAGFAEMWGVSEWSSITAPLAVDVVEGLCPCEGVCDFEEGSERQGIRVTDDVDNALVVLDGQRGELALPEGAFEIVVDAAVWQYCLNCFGTYRVLIAAK